MTNQILSSDIKGWGNYDETEQQKESPPTRCSKYCEQHVDCPFSCKYQFKSVSEVRKEDAIDEIKSQPFF